MKLLRDLTVVCLSVLLGLTILLTACDSESISSGADTTTGSSTVLSITDLTTLSTTELPQTVPVTTPGITDPVTTESTTTTAPSTTPDVPDVTEPLQSSDVTTAPPPQTEPTPEVCVHEYTESVEDATCTREGKKVYTCSKCGDSYSETIAKIAHDFVDATCTVPKTCTACGWTEGDVSGHDYSLVEIQHATCTEEGKRIYRCHCGDSYSETIAKLAHDFAEATCTAAKTCKSCGATEGKASGHSHKLTSTTNATCTAEGKKVYTCSKCGDSYSETIAKTEHTWVIESGNSRKHCSVCGAVEETQHNHKWEDATCDAPKTCSECGKTEGKALGHDWAFAACESLQRCSRCNGFGGAYISHEWNSRHWCTVCNMTQCGVYDHNLFYGRCY